MPNRLAAETSPYLLQHAGNPVDWFAWGPEALARARLLDRPIFLSIGYAACHWCHVMERESFEDEATAAALNAGFVSIKVDREERPDLDSIYMSAVQAMTGSGGWPMSVFLTPDGAPFYGGTYFPDTPRHGMPSFRQVLEGVQRAWAEQRDDVLAAGQRLVDVIVQQGHAGSAEENGPPLSTILSAAREALAGAFDVRDGSWGGPPKFPQSMTIEFLLRVLAEDGIERDPRALSMVRFTLDKMADGGIRDQLGGGFHRYATDAHWLVPHFEQMLYDNAQLARVYIHAWSLLGIERYRDVARGTLDYMLRELGTTDGAFAASQDADTEGVEGATFTWTAAEIREVLGTVAAARFSEAYGVTEAGNWEGVNLLSRVWPAHDDPPFRGDPVLEAELASARTALLARRGARPQPSRDDKALAAWNGLAIAAFAEAGRLFGEPAYTETAARAATTILGGLLGPDGALARSWKDDRAVGAGVLEDYSHLADGLLALYEATFEERWFSAARSLMDRVLDRFEDPAGGFFDTGRDHERLITRPRDAQDNAVPSGGAMATTVLLRLAAWTGDARLRVAADRAMDTVRGVVARYPTGFGQWLTAMSFAAADVVEVAIIGAADDPAMHALLAPVLQRWRPAQVVAVAAPLDAPDPAVPLLRDRIALGGRPTAYVCRGFVCDLPVTAEADLRALLAR